MKQLEEPYRVTIEVENRRCQGLKMLKRLGVHQCTLIDVRSSSEGMTRHLVKIPSKQIERVPKDKAIRIQKREKPGGETSAWFDVEGCDLCKTVLSHGSFVISGKNVEDYTIVYDFIAPHYEAFNRILSHLESSGLQPKVLEVAKFKPQSKILTDKQERTLWLALKMGFFNFPRKITMQELSQRLGIGLSTTSEITRRGIRRLLENHFET